jgi:hypothetical protein
MGLWNSLQVYINCHETLVIHRLKSSAIGVWREFTSFLSSAYFVNFLGGGEGGLCVPCTYRHNLNVSFNPLTFHISPSSSIAFSP